MALELTVRYRTAADLAGALVEHAAQGALLLPLREPPAGVQQYQPVTLQVATPEEEGELEAEVVQVLHGLGLVVRLRDPALAAELSGVTPPAVKPELPAVSLAAPREASPSPPAEDEHDRAAARGMGPVSWTLEKLMAEWNTLSMADRVRVAKYGKRPARGFIGRMLDSTLHNVLLSNPGITPEEVATLAGTSALDSSVLKRIISTPEYLHHSTIVRNLVCHPKATLPQVQKLIDHLSDNELRQLTKTGKVRASVKRIIIKKLEHRAARGR
jgi:hypothetical protein